MITAHADKFAGSGSAELPQSPFDVAEAAFRSSSAVSERVRALADRLCGSVPQAVSDENSKIGPAGGVLNRLEMEARHAIVDADEAMMAISRIEAHLPG